MTDDDLAGRLAAVRARIAAAALNVSRQPDSVTLLPVSKTHPVEDIAELARLGGVHKFGENRPQELAQKAAELGSLELEWVLIGPLQRNKAGLVARYAAQFQALDSLSVAEALERQLQHLGRPIDVMIEVNTSGEAAKHGVTPAAAVPLAHGLAVYQCLRPVGLMTVAAQGDEPVVRGCFRCLREVQSQLRDEGYDWPQLSMGMSADLEWAIEEGSTLVRVGTAIFGDRASCPGVPK